MNTYWINYRRGFSNEYTVAVATNKLSAAFYAAEGYARITRPKAMRMLAYRGDDATMCYVLAQCDHQDADRQAVRRALRSGTPIPFIDYEYLDAIDEATLTEEDKRLAGIDYTEHHDPYDREPRL